MGPRSFGRLLGCFLVDCMDEVGHAPDQVWLGDELWKLALGDPGCGLNDGAWCGEFNPHDSPSGFLLVHTPRATEEMGLRDIRELRDARVQRVSSVKGRVLGRTASGRDVIGTTVGGKPPFCFGCYQGLCPVHGVRE